MMIYSKYPTARLKYVLKFIFGEVYQAPYQITEQPGVLEHHNGCRIAYTEEKLEGAFHIPVSGLLSQTGIKSMDLKIRAMDDMKILYSAPGTTELQYDVFSAVFYMLSRYEEYLPFKPDRYGRFEADSCLAGRENFLDIPIVDLWLEDLREKIIEWFPGQHLAKGKFEFVPTTDVDQPYAVLHHGIFRTLAGQTKAFLNRGNDLNWRRAILKGESRDPFDTFDDIEWLHSRYHLRPILFYLCASYAKYDKSISPRSQAFTGLVRKTADFARIGIHPSYRSGRKVKMVGREISTLGSITGEKPEASRQHYLRLRFPDTYRCLLKEGIREDYSMGFASDAGFRAGTCRPFYFYDLELERETELKIFSFQLMDRTLKDYMGLSSEEAFDTMRGMVDRVHSVAGTLVSIWHNEAFSDYGEWKGWRELYIRMMDYIA